jgi:hypothetical protein
VKLQQPIRFAEPKMEQQPQVEQIFCEGGVAMENHALDPQQQLVAQSRMEVVNLGVNMQTGALTASGPGWLIDVRRGAADLLPGAPGVPADAAAVRPVALPVPRAADPNQLTCKQVRFQGYITGNIHHHDATFHDQVRAAYAPVDSWMATLDSDDPKALGPKGALLHCDELAVNDMSAPNSNTRAMELMAAGNVVAEGGIFTARAARMSYAEIKDLLILEGDGRTDAELYRQVVEGGKTSKAAAQKIFYWPKSNRSYVDGARSLEFNQAPGESGSEVGKQYHLPGAPGR